MAMILEYIILYDRIIYPRIMTHVPAVYILFKFHCEKKIAFDLKWMYLLCIRVFKRVLKNK
jgi:hypothetical protein